MRLQTEQMTYLTIEELQRLAAAKLEEAASLADGAQKDKVILEANNLRSFAEMKGWLSSGLKPPM